MPSSANRRRVELPTFMYERVQAIAQAEHRTITSVITELLHGGLQTYQPTWIEDRDAGRFNARAQHVLDRARAAAADLQQEYVGTEHLLLGLVEEEGGVAAEVLTALGLSTEIVRSAIVQAFGRGSEPIEDSLGFTARARAVLGLAIEEAGTMGSSLVRTEHILLALVRHGDGLAVEILDEMGVLGRVRPGVLERLGRPGTIQSVM